VSVTQFLITAVIAILVTVPIVLFIPRARKSPGFDRVLWVATWLLAFLGEWSAPSYFGGDSGMLNQWVIDQTPLIPALIGAIVGALSINIILWLLDRFSPPIVEEDGVAEPATIAEETNLDASPPETTNEQSPNQ